MIDTTNRLWIIVQIAAPAIHHFVKHRRGYSQKPNFRFGSVADYDAKDSILTVTGGTSAYDGMHGQLKLHARDTKGSEYDFVSEISK